MLFAQDHSRSLSSSPEYKDVLLLFLEISRVCACPAPTVCPAAPPAHIQSHRPRIRAALIDRTDSDRGTLALDCDLRGALLKNGAPFRLPSNRDVCRTLTSWRVCVCAQAALTGTYDLKLLNALGKVGLERASKLFTLR